VSSGSGFVARLPPTCESSRSASRLFAFTGNTHQAEATEDYEAARQAFTNKFQEQLDIQLTTTSRQLKEMALYLLSCLEDYNEAI
jgi:hypothetical protein